MGLSAASVADLTIENDRGTLHDFSKYLVKPKRQKAAPQMIAQSPRNSAILQYT